VAVTGGSGVVGSALLRHLVEAGHEVRALARSDGAAHAVQRAGARPVIGDLGEAESLDRLVAGVDWAFNVAGVNELCSRDRDRMWEVNVTGATSFLEACRRAGVGRVVHTSSAAAIGEADGVVGTEATPHRGTYLSWYERTKTEAERALLARRGDLALVVVSPSSVQGPGRASGSGRLLLRAAQGRLPVVYDAVFSLVDIDDCARGHVLAAEKGAPGERYILSGAILSVRDVLARLGAITGKDRRPRFVRPWLLSVLGRLGPLVGAGATLCPESVRVMLHGHRYDGTRATRELGVAYTPVDLTLRRTVEWLVDEGLLRT
jgi:dihydroflavonol-4-reductase